MPSITASSLSLTFVRLLLLCDSAFNGDGAGIGVPLAGTGVFLFQMGSDLGELELEEGLELQRPILKIECK